MGAPSELGRCFCARCTAALLVPKAAAVVRGRTGGTVGHMRGRWRQCVSLNATCELCRMQGELLSCTPPLLHACSNCAMKRLLVPFLFRAPRCARRNLGGGAGVGSCTDHFCRSFAVLWSTGEPLWSCQQLCRPSWSCRHVGYATRSCWAQLSKYSIRVIKSHS